MWDDEDMVLYKGSMTDALKDYTNSLKLQHKECKKQFDIYRKKQEEEAEKRRKMIQTAEIVYELEKQLVKSVYGDTEEYKDDAIDITDLISFAKQSNAKKDPELRTKWEPTEKLIKEVFGCRHVRIFFEYLRGLKEPRNTHVHSKEGLGKHVEKLKEIVKEYVKAPIEQQRSDEMLIGIPGQSRVRRFAEIDELWRNEERNVNRLMTVLRHVMKTDYPFGEKDEKAEQKGEQEEKKV